MRGEGFELSSIFTAVQASERTGQQRLCLCSSLDIQSATTLTALSIASDSFYIGKGCRSDSPSIASILQPILSWSIYEGRPAANGKEG